jgi:D-glycero-D-manno-heptose 1,7-bisphosphate phosphatase
MKRAVFLDRDGVINESISVGGFPRPPSTVKEVRILEGVVEAIQLLKSNNLIPVVVTNQPDVARGKTTQSKIEEINRHIGFLSNIEHFYTCIHDDSDLCNCRKPAPGLITKSAQELGLDLTSSFMVGDRWRDVSAGQAAGCRCFFIDYSYPEKPPSKPFTAVSSLLEAVRVILGEINGGK